jgi:flagellar protein FliJ
MTGKSFQFSLESVLRLRKHETETARRQLERIAAMRQSAEMCVAEAERVLNDHMSRPLAGGSLGPEAFRRHASYRAEARTKLDEARRRVDELARTEEEARKRLVERSRDEESLQQLYDDERMEHIAEQDAAEAAFLDEQAITGYNRRSVRA